MVTGNVDQEFGRKVNEESEFRFVNPQKSLLKKP